MASGDYMALTELRGSRGYQLLQALWVNQGKKIMDSLNKSSKLAGKDTSLRYHAGQWNGFDLAIGMLENAIADIERQEENRQEDVTTEELLKKIRESA